MAKLSTPLILIGTVHKDPYGYKKLLRLLREIKPEAISVEISPYSRAFRAQQVPNLRQTLRQNLQKMGEEDGFSLKDILSHGPILSIFFFLKDPFEWRAAETYAQENSAALFDIDLSTYAREKLAYLTELVSLENLRTLYQLPAASFFDEISRQYSRAKFLFQNPPKIWPIEKEVLEREVYLAERIKELLKKIEGKNFCHIGGWEHLLERPDGQSLFALLRDLNPQRILLPGNGE